jgi:OmpA-OmpF porin, OOP family
MSLKAQGVRKMPRHPVAAIVVLLHAALPGAVPAQTAPGDEVVTRQAIIRSLAAPRDERRGLVKVEDAAPGESPVEPERPAAAAPLSIAFHNIQFAIGSSELTPLARTQLDELGAALASPELRGFRFELVGHTDAKGSREYNQTLSERRASAAREYLVLNGIEPGRLVAIGHGMDFPSRAHDPYAAENRRVEIRNLGAR